MPTRGISIGAGRGNKHFLLIRLLARDYGNTNGMNGQNYY